MPFPLHIPSVLGSVRSWNSRFCSWVLSHANISLNLLTDTFTTPPSLHVHGFLPFPFLPFLLPHFPISSCDFQTEVLCGVFLISQIIPAALLCIFAAWRCVAGLHAISRMCHTVNLCRDPRREHFPCAFAYNSKCFICVFDCYRALNWCFKKKVCHKQLQDLFPEYIYKRKF